MKNIFKLLMIVILIISFNSCSSSDDDSSNTDLIIGTWKPVKDVDVYSNGTEDPYIYSDCAQQSRYTFTAAGIFDFIDFRENENDDCEELMEGFELVSGTWEKISDTQYKIVTTLYYVDTQQTQTEVSIPDEISFPNNNKMRLNWYTNDEEDNDYYLEFSRVE